MSCFNNQVMIRIISTFFLCFIINVGVQAQVKIDFYPKALQKELSKANGIDVKMAELAIKPNLAHGILLGKYYSIAAISPTSHIKYIYIGRVATCRAGGCSINNRQEIEKESEFFDYFILFDATCSVKMIKIFNYQASHGQEITSPGWLKQFRNYNGKTELQAGNNVDAISGATISVDAISFDIELKTKLLRKNIF